LKNIAVSLLALVAACSSKPADPRLTAAAETPPLEAATEARALVDSLTAAHLKEWAEGVEQLQAPLKAAVRRELARRAVKVREEEEPGQPATLHKEVEAIRVLTPLPPDPPPADFLDYLVWTAAHRGRDGYEEIWAMGLKAFPSLLKLRRDRHPSVLPTIGIVMSESIVGSRRWRASSDAEIAGRCREELDRCPADCKPHYRAILAALGDDSALDAFPALLKSDLAADQIYGHLLLDGMFSKDSPYADRELRTLVNRPPGSSPADPWPLLTRRVLAWWDKHHDRLSYDQKVGFWIVEK